MKKRLFASLLCMVTLFSLIAVKTFAAGKETKKTPLKITQQPKNVTAAYGAVAKTKVVATGDGLKYQWYFKDGNYGYKKSTLCVGDTYSIEMNESRANRTVYCVITDKYGNRVTSKEATVRAKSGVTITKQPKSVWALDGDMISTTVSASGEGLKYQWYFKDGKGGYKKSSITTNTYSIQMNASRSNRTVYCVITDKRGVSVSSKEATLKMSQIVIKKQPTSAYVSLGETVKTTVTATGEGLKYQWYFKDGTYPFEKSSMKTKTYSIEMNEVRNGRQVYCVITDKYGCSVKTKVVTLGVKGAVITKQPTAAYAQKGQTVKTSVTATGEGLKYQWYFKDGSNSYAKSSIKTNTYSIEMNESRSNRTVYCVITDKNGYSVKTKAVTLKMIKPFKITAQPEDAFANYDEKCSVSVKATGTGVKYQWYHMNPGKTTYSKAKNTTNTYTLTLTKENAGRRVYCVVTDVTGKQIKTDVATLARTKATFDRDLYKIKPGATRTLALEIKPEGTKDKIIWTSSDPAIAKVNAKGVVTGVKKGTVTITASGEETGFAASCKVKVCDVKYVAITFDDGPGTRTGELLDFLKENDIRVTFFVLGSRISGNQAIIKRQVAEGHEIGYHSWNHETQTELSTSRITSDFKKSNKLLNDLTGANFTLWRTPGGAYNTRVLNAVDVPHIYWSVDTLDWKYRETSRTCSVIKNNAFDGAIILLHDIHGTTINGAMLALKEMQAGDYEFVTVTELLSRNGSQPQAHKNYYRG